MKYKDYKNSYTNDNRIYSKKELYDMTLREIYSRKGELEAQYKVLGLPDEKELRNSENVVYIEAYTREDGTEVSAHWRSGPKKGTLKDDRLVLNKNNITDSEEIKTVNKYIRPVDGKITSNFGYRGAPTKGASTSHSGVDIGVPIGTPVKSIADGKVIAANGGMRGYGNGVFVDHGIINGKHVISEYGHLSVFDVKVGDKVKAGQIIAKSGNSGVSTGPHLHLTIRENNEPVDPKKYIGEFN